MQPLKVLFLVQGEGRGHITQALALGTMLKRAGHVVCAAIVSRGGDSKIPAYFEENLDAPITYVPSGRFIVDNRSRAIHWGRTLIHNSFRWRRFSRSFDTIRAHIATDRPDVLINFYEPLGGLFMVRHRPALPMIAVAHQFMFMHPRYVFPDGFGVQRRSVRFFTQLTGLRASRSLALSLFDAERLEEKKITVVPPILRDEFLQLPAARQEPFYLVYLYHHSLSADLIQWHRRHPEVQIHCFWNNPDAEETRQYSRNLTFHRLHGQRFLDMMARCRGMGTTAGFETLAEGMYLGKPLMLNPLRRHFEQHCNGVDGTRAGAAIQTSSFDLSRLIRFAKEYNYDASAFRKWVDQAERKVVGEIESTVAEYQRR
ncbi:MAG: UDP- glucuronosyltransferase [Bacteroidota bacterium]|nr:UDP- glucuronosyltransferase [Bacteroidota bacterium]